MYLTDSCAVPDGTREMASQLPTSAYFSPSLLECELGKLFAGSPQYAGHELLVPRMHDYCSLPHHDHGLMILRNEVGVEVLSNVCRHRQATIVKGSGNGKRISCPLHRWTYDTRGTLVSAPRFDPPPCPTPRLERYPTRAWNGLHFMGPSERLGELQSLPKRAKTLLNFEDYYFGHMEVHECVYNWKTFIEFYLEDYHVGPFHPGLGRFVSCDELEWDFGTHWSVQTVGFHRELTSPGNSEVYRAWHGEVLDYYKGKLPDVGAMWLLLYPNLMIEWYPLVLVISTVYPRGPDRSLNVVEYYHPRDLLQRPNGSQTAELAAQAYLETAIEDNEIGARMQEGRHSLFKRGKSEVGPYQYPMEQGMEHFHKFLRRQLNFDEFR